MRAQPQRKPLASWLAGSTAANDGHCERTKKLIESDPTILHRMAHDPEIENEKGEVYPFNQYLDRHVPTRSDALGIEHAITLNTTGCSMLTTEKVKLSLARLIVRYMTTAMNQALYFDAKNVVEAILEDFATGDVEHMQRKDV